MSIRSGLAAQVGIAAETTWGTRVVPDHFYEFNSEGIALDLKYIESASVRTGNRVLRSDRVVKNKKGAAGDIAFEVQSKGFGLLFKHALGSVAITTVAALTTSKRHRCTLGDPYGLGLTVQVGRPDTGGTVRPFDYLGGKIVSWELANSVDQFLMFTPTFDFADEDTSQSLASASYASSTELLAFTGGAVNFNSGAAIVKDISIKGTVGQKTDRYGIRSSSLKREPIINALTQLEGTATMEFESMTELNRFTNDTRVQIDATWSSATAIESTQKSQVVTTLPVCQFRGSTPNVKGHDPLELTLPFTVLYDGTNEPITLDYITLDTTS